MDKVVHFEIPYDDEERAKKFYSGVFNWQIVPIPAMHYNIVRTAKTDEDGMIQEPGAINGGLFKRTDGASTVIVINVDNVEEKIKEVVKAGGRVVTQPTKVGDMGLYAKVEDTEGNIIGIWENLPKGK